MPRMNRLAVALIAILPAGPVLADQAACEAAARAAMSDYDWPEPMRQNVQTIMGGNTIIGTAVSTGAHRAMYMDADGKPQSLSIDDKFYSTMDGGESWTLVQHYSEETMTAIRDGIRSQAENATNIVCQYGIDLDGKTVDHFAVDYVLHNTDKPMKGEYWLDSESGFIWRVKTVSTSDGTVIVQDNEPAPGATLPDPEG